MPVPPPILAENFQNLEVFIFGPPLVLLALAGLSFLPATRGHWSTAVLAWPAVILGVLWFLALVGGRAPLWMLAFGMSPAVLGLLALGLWRDRRRERERM